MGCILDISGSSFRNKYQKPKSDYEALAYD